MKAGFLADATLLIDLEKVGGLSLLPRLGRIHVPDLVWEEVAEGVRKRGPSRPSPLWWFWQRGRTEDQILEAHRRYEGLSLADASCLVLAKAQDLVLLTGDRRLRTAAEGEGLDVHGALYVVEYLVQGSHLRQEDACRWLRVWEQGARRLPKALYRNSGCAFVVHSCILHVIMRLYAPHYVATIAPLGPGPGPDLPGAVHPPDYPELPFTRLPLLNRLPQSPHEPGEPEPPGHHLPPGGHRLGAGALAGRATCYSGRAHGQVHPLLTPQNPVQGCPQVSATTRPLGYEDNGQHTFVAEALVYWREQWASFRCRDRYWDRERVGRYDYTTSYRVFPSFPVPPGNCTRSLPIAATGRSEARWYRPPRPPMPTSPGSRGRG